MVCQLFDRIVCSGDDNIWAKIAPIIVFGIIWLVNVIGRAAKSKSGKTEVNQPNPPPKPRTRQADLDDFVKVVKNRYAQAKQEAQHASEEQIYRPQQPLPPKKTTVPQKPFTPQPQMKSQESTPKTRLESIKAPEPNLPEVKDLPLALEPGLPDLSKQIEKVDEIPEEMTALDHHIYEPSHKPYLPEIMEQITHPDGLRKAFIYGEIFGRPVSLKED
jgi:hypothetical protein